jgi:hypothetical protein
MQKLKWTAVSTIFVIANLYRPAVAKFTDVAFVIMKMNPMKSTALKLKKLYAPNAIINKMLAINAPFVVFNSLNFFAKSAIFLTIAWKKDTTTVTNAVFVG